VKNWKTYFGIGNLEVQVRECTVCSRELHFLFLELESHCVVQAALELKILLPRPPEFWDSKLATVRLSLSPSYDILQAMWHLLLLSSHCTESHLCSHISPSFFLALSPATADFLQVPLWPVPVSGKLLSPPALGCIILATSPLSPPKLHIALHTCIKPLIPVSTRAGSNGRD
jgi:hypothetical protein